MVNIKTSKKWRVFYCRLSTGMPWPENFAVTFDLLTKMYSVDLFPKGTYVVNFVKFPHTLHKIWLLKCFFDHGPVFQCPPLGGCGRPGTREYSKWLWDTRLVTTELNGNKIDRQNFTLCLLTTTAL